MAKARYELQIPDALKTKSADVADRYEFDIFSGTQPDKPGTYLIINPSGAAVYRTWLGNVWITGCGGSVSRMITEIEDLCDELDAGKIVSLSKTPLYVVQESDNDKRRREILALAVSYDTPTINALNKIFRTDFKIQSFITDYSFQPLLL